ncbi:ATP-dependent DNA ligase [Gordonia hydrophobica]|uniref:DNA ligase n=1 Tax=Gordonia hydrophobica TaxID=40516 RepID=A0ABZ2TZC6_9ACTN|nr:ATP-dependent DNA ligase [Gordonia hydrophobica]MBM7369457.1 DNA ligase-1 [Gordonia hydrophobica]
MTGDREDATSLASVVHAATDVASTRSRSAKTSRLAELLATLAPDEVVPTTGLLLGRPAQGRLGIGWRTALAAKDDPASSSSLTVLDVDRAFTVLAEAHGPGSTTLRAATLAELMHRATADEQDYLVRVLTGEMRTGALQGIVTDAAATASAVPLATVRRAAMLSGDLGTTIRAALTGEDLTGVGLRPGVPVSPMLASTAATPADAVAAVGAASVETKLDGARIQVHRVNGRVAVYTRSLADITDRVPEIVDAVAEFSHGNLVLDGETLALDESGAARPFQETMSRFGSDAAEARGTALTAWFFDVLCADGASLIDEPLRVRRRLLAEIVGDRMIRGIEVAGPDEAARATQFFDDAVAAGNEGVVVKGLESDYAAGRRGSHWIKVKPVYTYDLVVLAVERGSGRRTGQWSNLHLGARDPEGEFGEPGGFVMVGKTFKGLTDEILAWQTRYFPTIALDDGTDAEDGAPAHHVLWVRPETVVEVAIDGVQRSSRYPGGVALRFARVRRYRTDVVAKAASDADTIGALRGLLRE